MLRRKLLMFLGPLVGLLAAVLIVAILLLQDVMQKFDHLGNQSWVVVDDLGRLSNTLSQVEIELYAIQLGTERRLDKLMDAFGRLREQTAALGERYIVQEEGARSAYQKLGARVGDFEQKVAGLGTAQEPSLALARNRDALSLAVQIRQEVVELSRYAADHGQLEQSQITARFKWLVLGLSIIFMVLINASVIVLLRMAGMILNPVDKLVAASRELAAERFEHRVELDQKDEFGELARAYNGLAAQLQLNEQRRLDTLGLVATTLNHELNNAMAIIELQLQLLSRRAADGGAPVENCLRRIHEGLERMGKTVESLKHIKRIVLTDYVEGTKMLDLEQSTRTEGVENEPALTVSR